MAQDITTLIYMMLVSVCWIGGQCETPACNDDPTGVNYRGNLSQTINNHTCQRWTSQLPHDHTRTPTNYPNAGLGDHNYCRNPDGEATAWCYTNVVEIRWEYCAVGYLDPICQDVFPNASPLGIESGAIPDSSFSASSMYNSDHGPWRGRLNIAREGNLRGGWSSVTEDTNQFIQVDLLTTYRIIGVATQGRQDFAQWVTSFKISCSLDGVAFDTVKDPVNATVDKIFPGNSDQDTVVYNRLPVSTLCRYVRLLPYTWQAWVSLRMELYGEGPIEETPPCEEDPTGVNFRGNLSQTINNHTCQQWTSQYPQSHTRTPANYPNAGLGDHNYCRNPDDSDTAWCYTTLAGIRWEYCAVGFLDPRCQVITTINVPSTSPMTTFPVQQVTSQTPADVFPSASPLGIESGAIPDSSFSSSSMYDSDHGPRRGRLNIAREGILRGGWSAAQSDVSPFIQIDLLTTYYIIGVATQGRQDVAQWVTSFKISCSLDGVAFDTVKDPVNATVDEIFPGNSDQDTVVYNRLPVSMLCRYVRLLPYTWQAWVSLRMELYGEGPIEETPACEEDPTGVNFRGNLSQTINNHTCQPWTSQYPQSHTRTPANYPNAGLGDHNYCRNPDDSDTAWCYTTLAGIRWEYCAVGFLDPRCQDQNTTLEPGQETTQTPLSGTNQFATAPLTPTEAPRVTSATTLHSTGEYYENSTSSLTNETSLSKTKADETTVHLETTQIDQGTTITSTHPATVTTALKTSGHPQTQLINNETPIERTITTNVWTSPKETTPPPLKGLWKALAEMNNAETVSFGISLSMVLYFVSMILALTVRCIMIWIKGLRKREVKLDIERPRRMYELVNF